MITREELAAMVDHTLLKPESTADQVAELAREAGELGTYSICVSPSRLDVDLPEGVKLATVCGFPSGAHPAQVKAAEAAVSVANGADEVDMVINLGLAVAGDWDGVRDDIEAVRAACPAPAVLKVIIESAALTDDQIVAACREAEAAAQKAAQEKAEAAAKRQTEREAAAVGHVDVEQHHVRACPRDAVQRLRHGPRRDRQGVGRLQHVHAGVGLRLVEQDRHQRRGVDRDHRGNPASS